MKKIIVALLTLTMLLTLAVPAFAAEAVNPADAKDGDLIYTVDFRGDDVFSPEHFGADSSKKFTITPSEDGTSINIKGIPEAGETGSGYWGGIFKDITLGKDDAYTMIYKVRANGTVGKNNSVGVGGVIIDKLIKTTNFYCNYGNHNTQGEGGDVSMRRTSISKGSAKMVKDDGSEYIMWDTIGNFAVDADGFVTMMLEFDATNKEMSSSVMAEGAGDGTQASDWIKLETQTMPVNMVADAMGFKLYVCYTVVDTDVKDVQLYKGIRVDYPEETTAAPETDAPTEAEQTTEAPATDTEPVAAAGGCGGTVTVAGMTIVAALGTCAVVTSKKRR